MTRRLAILAASAAALAVAPAASAQSLPEGWTTVADTGDASAVAFQAMAPGWHLNPGAAGLIYRPEVSVEPPFRVEFEAYRFPGEPSGYGVFVGGRGLEPGAWDYFEVLLDGQGRFRLGHQAAAEYHEIVPWTAHEAIATPTDSTQGHNVLTVEARANRFTVSVNGVELTSFEPPAYARFDGVVGIRVLDGVNVHVVRLDVAALEPDPEAVPGR